MAAVVTTAVTTDMVAATTVATTEATMVGINRPAGVVVAAIPAAMMIIIEHR